MKLETTLDVSLVAHEQDDVVTALVDLEAPVAAAQERPPGALAVVLDRSGSMHGAPLEGAKRALIGLVERLDPTDTFALVTFDDDAQVVVPGGPLADKDEVVRRIAALETGGCTDLGAGHLRGIRELKRAMRAVAAPTGAGEVAPGGTLLIISDGHVNRGMTEVSLFEGVTAKAHAAGITTSTLGYGVGYDETLLAAIARAGSGNHVFAADPDAAGAAIAREVDGLLEKVVQAATLTVRFEPAVAMLRLYNDLPAQQLADGAVLVELGDLYGAEQRKLLMSFQVPALAALGPARVATLELQYVELPGLVEHLVTLPVSVNVVPGDEAAQRVPDPTVHSEVLFQEAQESKRRASEAFERGDVDTATGLLGAADGLLDEAMEIAPARVAETLQVERGEVQRMRSMTASVDAAYLSKLTRDSYHLQNRKRGRGRS